MRNEQYTIDASRRLKFVISITNRYAVDRFVVNSDTTTLKNKQFGEENFGSPFFRFKNLNIKISYVNSK